MDSNTPPAPKGSAPPEQAPPPEQGVPDQTNIDSPSDESPVSFPTDTSATAATLEDPPNTNTSPVGDLPPKSSLSQPQPMEIHHHTHTARKKFKHYAFEFFMLFFAVFCGFFAEYQLEHKIEHDREKQYMVSLVRDLQTDTVNLNAAISGNNDIINSYNALLTLLKMVAPEQKANELYYHFIQTTNYETFNPVDRTIQQLQNAGGMRLVRNMAASDSITAYYEMISDYKDVETTFKDQFYKYHDDAYKVFDYKQIQEFYSNRDNLLHFTGSLNLASYDPSLLTPLYNKLFMINIISKYYVQRLHILKQQAIATLLFIRKEYKLS